MGTGTLLIGWVIISSMVLCNMVAGGAAALFHIWSGDSTPGVRMLAAAATGGFLPAAFIGGTVMISAESGLIYEGWVVMALMFLLGMFASIPLAVIVTRRLHRPEDAAREFE